MEWVNDYYKGDPKQNIKTRTGYICPVCKLILWSEKEVVEHYTPELEWQKMHLNTKKGDKFKYLEDGKIKEIFTVKQISWCHVGRHCGHLLTIFVEGYKGYFTAGNLNNLQPVSNDEIKRFHESKKQERVLELKQEIKVLRIA